MREIQEEIDVIFCDFMCGLRFWSYCELGERIEVSEIWRELFVDIFDRGDCFVIIVEFLGVRKEDIKFCVIEDIVYIEVQMRCEKEFEQEGVIRIECYYSGYRRVIRFLEEVILEKVKVCYNNGVLEIEILKKKFIKFEKEGVEVKIE